MKLTIKNVLFAPVLLAIFAGSAATEAWSQGLEPTPMPFGSPPAPAAAPAPAPVPAAPLTPAVVPAASTPAPATLAPPGTTPALTPAPAATMPAPGLNGAAQANPAAATTPTDQQIQSQAFPSNATGDQSGTTLSVPPAGRLGAFETTTSSPNGEAAAPHAPVGEDIAMMYYRLSYAVDKKDPPFSALAMELSRYKEATGFEKDNVRRDLADEMWSSYRAITFDALPLRLPVRLSTYSKKNGGFVILDLDDQPILKYSFAGQNFAVVPRHIMDHQFIKTTEKDADLIGKSEGPKSSVTLMMYVKPDFADSMSKMTEIDGVDYHLLSGEVDNIQLWDVGEKHLLWDDRENKNFQGAEDGGDLREIERLKQ